MSPVTFILSLLNLLNHSCFSLIILAQLETSNAVSMVHILKASDFDYYYLLETKQNSIFWQNLCTIVSFIVYIWFQVH